MATPSDSIYLSSISVVEVTYLVEKGKLPESALQRLIIMLASPASAFEVGPLDLGVAQAVHRVFRDMIPDVPDRIIAATALSLNLPRVTRDPRIRAANIQTIW